jgi:hypothetical protein
MFIAVIVIAGIVIAGIGAVAVMGVVTARKGTTLVRAVRDSGLLIAQYVTL